MVTHRGASTVRRRRVWVLGLVIAAAMLVPAGGATAGPANLADPAGDAGGSPLDVTAASANDSVSQVTFGLTTSGAFTDTNVSRITFEFDFNKDGVRDNCLIVNPTGSGGNFEGTIFDGCNGSSLIGTAAVTHPTGTTLQAALPIQTLRDAGLGTQKSYGFRLTTNDVTPPHAENVYDDQAPDATSAFSVHKFSKGVKCGDIVKKSVKLKQDLVGCNADGLVVGKSGSKSSPIVINLNGHKVESVNIGAPVDAGVGIRVDGFKFIRIKGGSSANDVVAGFHTGILVNDAKKVKVQNVEVQGNKTGINVAGGTSNILSKNTVQNNSDHGVVAGGGGTKHKIDKNVVQTNGNDGISHPNGTDVRITNNTVTGNGTDGGTNNGDGLDVDSTDVIIGGNQANNNDGDGINAPDQPDVRPLVVKKPNGKKVTVLNTASDNFDVQCTPTRLCTP